MIEMSSISKVFDCGIHMVLYLVLKILEPQRLAPPLHRKSSYAGNRAGKIII
jgi:hypothetical protein